MAKDYYKTLGVDKKSSKEEIKKAFRKLAHQHHPDKKGGDADKFKEINEAYSVLSDDKKRTQYDTFGSGFTGAGAGPGGVNTSDFAGFDFSNFRNAQGGFEFDLGDIFGDIFGGGRERGRAGRGRDISVDVEISFEDSVFGADKDVRVNKISTCKTCGGSGARVESALDTCIKCNGKGRIREVRSSIIGSFSTVKMCDLCGGTGKVPREKCETCGGKGVEKRDESISVSIPAGIENGEMLRLGGLGEAVKSGISGDLYINVRVRPHPLFVKEGHNLRTDLRVKLSDTLLGSEYSLKTIDGEIFLRIPEGTRHGDVLRVKGKGVPFAGMKRGDILVTIYVEMPKKLSREARKQIENLKKEGL